MTALVDFLASLRPAGQPPAVPAAATRASQKQARHESRVRRVLAVVAVQSAARRVAGLEAAVYFRGWRHFVVALPAAGTADSLAAFFGGLAAIFLALASPIEPFASLLLSLHMVQHLLLMMVAPPLIWLGAPSFRCSRLAATSVRRWIAPLLRARVAAIFRPVDPSVVALPLFVGTIGLARAGAVRLGSPFRCLPLLRSTRASWPRRCCSGIRSSAPMPSRPAGRCGSCSLT